MPAAQAAVPSLSPLPMRERVQLCKLLVQEVSPWRPLLRRRVRQRSLPQGRRAATARSDEALTGAPLRCVPARRAGWAPDAPRFAESGPSQRGLRCDACRSRGGEEEQGGGEGAKFRYLVLQLGAARGQGAARAERKALREAARPVLSAEAFAAHPVLRCWYGEAASAMEVGAAEGGAGSQEPVQAVAASVATGADGMVKKRRLGVAAVPIAAGAAQACPPSEEWGRLVGRRPCRRRTKRYARA